MARLTTADAPMECSDLPCDVAISEPLVRLSGDVDSTGLSDPFYPVGFHEAWGLITAASNQRGTALIWDWSGRVARTVGSEGSGPGESEGLVSGFVDSQGRLHLKGESRWSIFDSDGVFLRRVDAPFAPAPLNLLLNDSTVVSGWVGQSQFRITHLGDASHEEFGERFPAHEFSTPWAVAVGSAPGEFWGIRADGAVIERWSVRGERLEQIRLQGAIFPRDVDRGSDASEGAPPVYVLELRVVDEMIWVTGGVRETASDDDTPTFFVQALSRASGESVGLAMGVDDGPVFNGFVNDTLGWRVDQDALGQLQMEVVRFGLVARDR